MLQTRGGTRVAASPPAHLRGTGLRRDQSGQSWRANLTPLIFACDSWRAAIWRIDSTRARQFRLLMSRGGSIAWRTHWRMLTDAVSCMGTSSPRQSCSTMSRTAIHTSPTLRSANRKRGTARRVSLALPPTWRRNCGTARQRRRPATSSHSRRLCTSCLPGCARLKVRRIRRFVVVISPAARCRRIAKPSITAAPASVPRS